MWTKDPVTWRYPITEPFNSGRLKVSDLHELYFEEVGNSKGKPVVFLHGGPGGGVSPKQRGFFDPAKYRAILFDQRGCGRSTPHACLEANTTWDLVADIEKLRQHLKIEKWQVFGGSWGSTLALTYAQTHPSKVTELVLRGIFLLRKKEIDWFYQDGASRVFPEEWEKYVAPIPENERGDFLTAFHKRQTGTNLQKQADAARAWSVWEGSTARLLPDPELVKDFEDGHYALAFARIENHYFMNKGFFETDDHLLRHVDKIRSIPAVIVQGRYDMCCPMDSAWALHRAWPEAELIVVPDAGHSVYDGGISRALIAATDKFATWK